MVRAFKNQDLNAIMDLWLEANIAAHSFIKREYWQNNYHAVKNSLPNATLYVYEQNGLICGFIGLINSYIAGIFVAPNMQSKGIGRQLLDYAKTKYSRLELHVYKNNAKAVRFYLRELFVPISEQVDANTGETELIMYWTK